MLIRVSFYLSFSKNKKKEKNYFFHIAYFKKFDSLFLFRKYKRQYASEAKFC